MDSILFKASMVQAIQNTKNSDNGLGPCPIDHKRPYKWNTRRVIKFPHMISLDFIYDNPQEWAVAAYEDGGGNWIFWSMDAPDGAEFTKKAYPNGEGVPCPYGKPGSRLYVRESWRGRRNFDDQPPSAIPPGAQIWYEAGGKMYPSIEDDTQKGKLRPGIFMPKWASRIQLEVTAVRAQRVQCITPEDALAEGALWRDGISWKEDAVQAFATLWDSINGQPKPVYEKGKRLICYVSYPWEAGFCEETYRGKPHVIFGNPYVWALSFCRVEGMT